MYDVPEQLIVEADGPIRIITMNNPDMRNAFIDPLHEAMRNIWYQISRDRDARAVVLTGAGTAFCAGGNVPGLTARRALRTSCICKTASCRRHPYGS